MDWIMACRGVVRMRVTGFSPERFMNLCSKKGIVLWDVRQVDSGYEMCTHPKDFLLLRPMVRKSGTKVVLLEKYGLPFLVKKIKKRKAFLAGALMALGFWIWSMGQIWDLGFEGNNRITEQMLWDYLEGQHVYPGMSRDKLDLEELEKGLRSAFPLITWTSAGLNGTKLLIRIKENEHEMVTEQSGQQGAADLVAGFDGRIVSMIVRQGIPRAAIGEEKHKGDVLVEGAIPILAEDGTVRYYDYVQADGDVVFEHSLDYRQSLCVDCVRREYTGNQRKRPFVRVGENKWYLPLWRKFACYETGIREMRPEMFKKLRIPIYFGTEIQREYKNVGHRYSETEIKSQLNDKLELFLANLEEKGVQIIEKNVKIEMNGAFWTMDGSILVWERGGEHVAITEVENDNE